MPKSYELHLPVFKQGTDLNHALRAAHGDQAKALRDQAEFYEIAASMCLHMADVLEENPEVKVYADTHTIVIDGPEAILAPLGEEGLLCSCPNHHSGVGDSDLN
jgi:hypothetical protein